MSLTEKVKQPSKKAKYVLLMAIIAISLTISPALSRPKSSFVTDPAHNWDVNVNAKGYSDIIYARVDSVPSIYFDNNQIQFTMILNAPIPKTPTDQALAYIWSLNLNGDGLFNTPGDLNVRVAYDGDVTHGVYYGWHAYLDGNDWSGIMYTFTIKGNVVTFTFPLSYLGNPTSFKWCASSIQMSPTFNGDSTSIATWG